MCKTTTTNAAKAAARYRHKKRLRDQMNSDGSDSGSDADDESDSGSESDSDSDSGSSLSSQSSAGSSDGSSGSASSSSSSNGAGSSSASGVSALSALAAPKPQLGVQLFKYGGGQSEKWFVVTDAQMQELAQSPYSAKIDKLYKLSDGSFVAAAKPKRSYNAEPEKQMMRWLSSFLLYKYKNGREIQCYFRKGDGTTPNQIYVASNMNSLNDELSKFLTSVGSYQKILDEASVAWSGKTGNKAVRARHLHKLSERDSDPKYAACYDAMKARKYVVITQKAAIYGLHAERRISEKLAPEKLDLRYLGGVKRPCAVCAMVLGSRNSGPMWVSGASTQRSDGKASDYEPADFLLYCTTHNIQTFLTASEGRKSAHADHDTDSDTDIDKSSSSSGANSKAKMKHDAKKARK